MGWFLFIDESGHDRKVSPYEVLAGVAIEDRDLWNLIQRAREAETNFFGMRVTDGPLELKAKKLLKNKVFRHAAQEQPLEPGVRRELARDCLLGGAAATPRQLAALGQAKVAFVGHLLELCAQHRVRAFASIVDRDAQRPGDDSFLRKDYSFLFERFFYFLEDCGAECMGVVVFDERDKAQSHILLDQMEEYFIKTANGRMRASRIVPEPFFVHSELTTAIQFADIIAYIISWGVRFGEMTRPARTDLASLAEQVCALRYRTVRDINGEGGLEVWSFRHIADLRPRGAQ